MMDLLCGPGDAITPCHVRALVALAFVAGAVSSPTLILVTLLGIRGSLRVGVRLAKLVGDGP